MNFLSVSTTTPTAESARELARLVMEAKLAACCHISPIESLYLWNGAVQNDKEFVVSFKTTADCFEPIHTLLRRNHPYELPALYSVPWVQTTERYGAWVQAMLRR
jgi:periplasmic divalent cation tolerance protein